MATTTTNYQLTLPATSEKYSITILNANFSKIDTAMQEIAAGADVTIISDDITGTSTTWSSSKIKAEIQNEHYEQAIGVIPDGSVTRDKLSEELKADIDNIPAATLEAIGGVKPYTKSVNGVTTNRSGLLVNADGSILVLTKVNGGLAIDGAGQLYVAGADISEVFGGTQQYKPITPAQFNRFITYSTTPQRIGTWIDGTPVWRQAIPMTAITGNGLINVAEYLSCSNPFILKSDIFVQNQFNDTSPEAFADKETYSILYEGRYIKIEHFGDPEYADYAQAWYGIVEFAAAEDDIKTS